MKLENTETFKNLARSFAGECQAGMRYQMIAKLAMKEGLKTLQYRLWEGCDWGLRNSRREPLDSFFP